MLSDLACDITATVTQAERDAARTSGQHNPGIQSWIDAAAKAGITATLAGLPVDGFPDGDDGRLLALVMIGGDYVVLTISDPHGPKGSNTIAAREPQYDEVVTCFSRNL